MHGRFKNPSSRSRFILPWSTNLSLTSLELKIQRMHSGTTNASTNHRVGSDARVHVVTDLVNKNDSEKEKNADNDADPAVVTIYRHKNSTIKLSSGKWSMMYEKALDHATGNLNLTLAISMAILHVFFPFRFIILLLHCRGNVRK